MFDHILRLFSLKKDEIDLSLGIPEEDGKKYLCGFSLKSQKPLNKVCQFENHQDSKVFCESCGFCSLKVEINDITVVES
jgi:hypothetical protein